MQLIVTDKRQNKLSDPMGHPKKTIFSHRKRLVVSTGFKDHKSWENRDINIIHSLTERGWLYRQDLKTINHGKIEISISFILSQKEVGCIDRI